MSSTFSLVLLACFGLSLILITLSLRLLRTTEPPGTVSSCAARFFLIALRVAIGWHCFIEGMEKISAPAWSSEPYLRESMGPLSSVYRGIPGDRLLAKATLGPDGEFPAELEREWAQYFVAFASHYDLDDDQVTRALAIFDQRKADTVSYFKSKAEPVIKIAPFPPELPLEMTMEKRLKEHERLAERVRAAEAKFPTDDRDVHAEWKQAKADLAKWRGELKRVIDGQTDKLKKIDPALKDKIKKNVDSLTAKLQNAKDKKDDKEAAKLQKDLDEESAKLWEPLADVLTSEQRLKGPMPETKGLPVSWWRLLELSDFGVKWGLVVLGACLMLGILSRCTSAATALLVLSFYLAMPPLPGWPEGPRLEGHYMLVNKTLIEVIALFALTFIPTGRWAGLDGLLLLVLPSCCSGAPTCTDAPTK